MIKLDVEVDFSHTKGMVALRFFEEFEGGRRMPVRMQRLYNLAVQCRKAPKQFKPEDRELLIKLSKDLAKPSVLGKNLQLLILTHPNWNTLRASSPLLKNRFRDRQSGAVYTTKLSKAMVYFELECHGDRTLFSAVVDMPDGSKLPWHKVKDNIRQSRKAGQAGGETLFELAMDGYLAELDLPVKVEMLNQIFGQDNQRINTTAVAPSLPVLIEHRLDRLRGASVTRDSSQVEGSLQLTAEGADIILTPRAGKQTLRFGNAAGTYLKRKGDGFVIVESRCSHFKAMQALINDLPLVEQPNGSYKLEGKPHLLNCLCSAMETLPNTMTIDRADELKYLTGQPVPLTTSVNAREMAGWFEFDLECRVGNLHVSEEDLKRAVRREESIIRTRDGYWLKLDDSELQQTTSQLAMLDGDDTNRRVTSQFNEFIATLHQLPNLQLRRGAKALADSIRMRKTPHQPELPTTISNLLRPYQREGIEFLFNRTCWRLGSLLADDMGLGKTIQVLSTISALKAAKELTGNVLVVCPASVIFVWQAEVLKFFPELRVALLNGSPDERQSILGRNDFDIAVCSYAVMRNDLEQLNGHHFGLAVLDEAQHIRNAKAQVSMAARALNADRRLALTGTPLENRLTDLWSIVEFLNPGYLGAEKSFEAVHHTRDLSKLRKKLTPIMLRRRKTDVAKDLPPRTEEVITIPFTSEQAEFYQTQLTMARQKARGRNSMQILAALTRLRQVCCHTALVDDTSTAESAKLNYLLEMVQEILDEGHSILVFSQFTSMLDIIEDELNTRHLPNKMLTGATSGPKRRELVERFNSSGEPEVFLLSLKAAGTGLTLTKADYVIIYDPWWNPAAESQAIDRTHRIGQNKPVMAYRLVAAGSIEEKILKLQEEKRALFQSAIEDADTTATRLTADELADLLN